MYPSWSNLRCLWLIAVRCVATRAKTVRQMNDTTSTSKRRAFIASTFSHRKLGGVEGRKEHIATLRAQLREPLTLQTAASMAHVHTYAEKALLSRRLDLWPAFTMLTVRVREKPPTMIERHRACLAFGTSHNGGCISRSEPG